MRTLLSLLAGAVLLLGPTPGRATLFDFTGSLSLEIGSLDPAVLPAITAAQVNITTTAGGNAIQSLTLPKSQFAERVFLPVPNNFPIIQIVLTGRVHTVGSSTETGPLKNDQIVLTRGGNCDAGHLTRSPTHTPGSQPGPLRGIRCPGGGLAGFGALNGTALVGIFKAQFTTLIHTFFSSVSAIPIGTAVHTRAPA